MRGTDIYGIYSSFSLTINTKIKLSAKIFIKIEYKIY
jgi:hypothetical protein